MSAKYIATKNSTSHYLCEKHRSTVDDAKEVLVIEIAGPELPCDVCTEQELKDI